MADRSTFHSACAMRIMLLTIAPLVFGSSEGLAFAPPAIGWTEHGTQTTAGYIGTDGRLLLFDGGIAGWKLRPDTYPHSLTAGSPLVLFPQSAGELWPTLVTVRSDNRLIRITNGGKPKILMPAHSFPTGAHLDFLQNGPQQLVTVVSGMGDLWLVDIGIGTGVRLNGLGETFPFGASTSVISIGTELEVFAVDDFGTLIWYAGGGGSWSSTPLAGGLLPGAPVASGFFDMTPEPGPELVLTTIDASGQLLLWTKSAGLPWSAPTIVANGQVSGSPLEIGLTPAGPVISTISGGGRWNLWSRESLTSWKRYVVGPGFSIGAPIAFAPAVGTVWTIDPLGRLVCAVWTGSDWQSSYVIPTLSYAPQLVSRQFVPNEPLAPAQVTLTNTGTDPLLVQIVDLFDPRQPPEEKIAPRGQLQIELPRESGGFLEEVFLIPGPGGILIEQTARHPIAPEQRFSLVVWSDRETYKVLPFKKAPKGAPKSVTEGFSRRSQVSLGVVPVPPGELLRDQEQMDLVALCKRLRNPGAVVHFPKPVSQP